MTETEPLCNCTKVERRAAPCRGNVMVVDDQPANLRLMEEMLQQQGYHVRSFPRGRMALNAATQHPPDLFLLDINMPEMNGFEVCERLKADKNLASIPVIFLSANSETEDKVKAFQSGGVDYVTKPFQFEEVQARVETHLQLQRARLAERDLLDNTLNKAIRSLAEVVHLTGPVMSSRSEAIKAAADHIVSRLALEDRWQYDLAATLCLIGCISLPAEAFQRAYVGDPISEDEEKMFRAHPENGARFLANIPRLENVAEMIRQQQTISAIGSDSPVERGACMLRVALELDRQLLCSGSLKLALAWMRGALRGIPREMLTALEDYSPPQKALEIKRLQARELRASMVLEDDVMTLDGNFMILPKGTMLTETLVERVQNFDKTRRIKQPIHVGVMCPEKNSKGISTNRIGLEDDRSNKRLSA